MEKLTLENIAPYLPYGLKLLHTEFEMEGSYKQVVELSTAVEECLTFSNHKWGASDYHYEVQSNPEIKPILRNMDLTNHIIVEGKEVIPIVELARISIPHFTWSINDKGEATYIDSSFYYLGNDFCVYWQGEAHIAKNQLALFKWLYANKFDIDGLIEKGLAIDCNTLETNPYN